MRDARAPAFAMGKSQFYHVIRHKHGMRVAWHRLLAGRQRVLLPSMIEDGIDHFSKDDLYRLIYTWYKDT